jgi:hypothetical protein
MGGPPVSKTRILATAAYALVRAVVEVTLMAIGPQLVNIIAIRA